MYNTINVWYGNWEKVCVKRSWQKEDAKKGGPALYTDKNFIRMLFQKKDGTYFFEKKQLEFPGLLFHP